MRVKNEVQLSAFSDWVDPDAVNPGRVHKRVSRFDYLDLPDLS